ncbi:MAG TPA: amidohydrolase family protein [Solirubrobacteraceae bacterium]
MQVDVHQHLWPAPLIDALRRRATPPRLRGWRLEVDGQADYPVDPAAHDPAVRAEQARHDGLDLALVSLSSPLGIEYLPPGESDELLDAYHEGVRSLPAPFRGWAAAGLTEPDGAALERELDRGSVGLQLPATALLDEAGYRCARPLLDVLHAAQRPLMIHPGPSPATAGTPGWWPAMVGYVQQMHASWFAFRQFGRPRYPGLRVCFALLAGLAPLHGERFAARSHERGSLDENAFLDTSSYGTRAIDATIRVLGIDVLVHGSDRPYAKPTTPDLGAAALAAIRSSNPLRLMHLKEVPDALAPVAMP